MRHGDLADLPSFPTRRSSDLPRVFRARSTLEALARDSVEAYFHGVSILRDNMRRELFSNGFKAKLNGYNAVEVFHRHARSEEHTSELQSHHDLVCRLLLEKKK